MVSPTSHHGRKSRACFKIGGEEMRFPSQLVEDQKSKVSYSTHRCLYHRGKPKQFFEIHAQDNARRARCLSFFTIQTTQCPTRCEWGLNLHINNIDPPSVAGQQGR
jgi:hypothetical protein